MPSVSIRRVPKLRLAGAWTIGPSFSLQVRCNRDADPSTVQAMATWPAGTDSAPNFVVLVQSSLSVIAIAITAPEVIWRPGPSIENLGKSGLSKASVAPRTIFPRSALVHRASKSRSCARPNACKRPSIACCACSVLEALRRLCEAMALTVARVFLIRWCSSSRISFCSLSDASRSLASMPALASKPWALISACARRSRRLTFSASRKSSCGSAPLAGELSGRRSALSIANHITIRRAPHIFGGRVFCRNRALLAVFGAKSAASGMADHAPHLGYHFDGFERLAEEAAVGRKIDAWLLQLSRYDDDLDRRPALTNRMRKSQTIHAARHLDVGHHQRDVGSGLQDCDGSVGVHGLNRRVAGVFDHVDGAHAQHHLVLDDENDGWNA